MSEPVSAVTQHSAEIVSVLIWMLLAGGSVFIAVIGWIGNRLFGELQGIKDQISKTNETLGAIERDLRSELTHLDRRLTVIETRCNDRHDD
jgi:hypothetical protein